jgi:hypothetical protein
VQQELAKIFAAERACLPRQPRLVKFLFLTSLIIFSNGHFANAESWLADERHR